MYRVTFVREKKEVLVEAGTTLLQAEIEAGLRPDAPCGGAGKCGKCLVRLDGRTVKACQTRVECDVAVETIRSDKDHAILSEGYARELRFDPELRCTRVTLKKPLPGEKRSEWERLLDSLAGNGGPSAGMIRPELDLVSRLYGKRTEREDWYVLHTDHEILELFSEEKAYFLAAFDIGTTTVAGYLLDGRDGREIAVESALNPQVQYGADVIMRSNYCLEHGEEELSSCIRETVNAMLHRLAERAGIRTEEIFQVSIVGNTCMHHLFLGISPASLVHAPYVPAIRERMTLRAADYGLTIHPRGQIVMLPNIAGYVGADTCGCILAVRPDLSEDVSLILDIGTNGEMVLGNRERLAACSTAAGPAFEGAKIECGMRGAAGAVDHVSFEDGEWRYTTVGGARPEGLCGSGLIDLVAELVRTGKISEAGTLQSGQENPKVFMLVPPEESATGKGVYVTQKDVGELQLAKAAIAAGIQLLMQRLGIEERDIRRVYIAGAFGNYMNAGSAGGIGLLPGELSRRVKPVGNAAGEGAKIALVNRGELRRLDELAGEIDFLELAASPDFQDCFMDELSF